MLRHLLKLLWKRRTRHLLLSLEIMLAFMLVFAVAAVGMRSWQLYRQPLGFDYRDVWSVTIQPAEGARLPADAALYTRLREELRALPQVEHAAFSTFSPYTNYIWFADFKHPASGANVLVSTRYVSDEFFAVHAMTAAAGKWFGAADQDGATPVVINQYLADQFFPGKAAVGQVFHNREDGKAGDRFRVTAVVEAFRIGGEFEAPGPMVLMRSPSGGDNHDQRALLLRLKPGTPREFEAVLRRQLKLVRNDWTYTVEPMADLRAATLKRQMSLILVLGLVGAFLLAMVMFGLLGVLWQDATRRTAEIGLRRALGAPAAAIYRQMVAEQLLLSTGAMLAGLALLVQLPLTGAFGEALNWTVFFGALGLSAAAIYLLSLLCSLYPGWRASRLTPTAALRYE